MDGMKKVRPFESLRRSVAFSVIPVVAYIALGLFYLPKIGCHIEQKFPGLFAALPIPLIMFLLFGLGGWGIIELVSKMSLESGDGPPD